MKRSAVLLSLLLIVLLLAGALLFIVMQPVLATAGARPAPEVNPARLEAHVRVLSEKLVPRDYAHPENLDRAAAYISDELAAAGGRVSEQTFQVGERTYRNVVAFFGPDSPERVVIGAHYDTDGPLPGADDNASGVAGLLELARLLGRAQLPGQVELVAFALEELPFYRTPDMGSAVHAASLRRDGVQVKAMISLEMIGYFRDEPGSQSYPFPGMTWLYPSRGHFVGIVGHFRAAGITRIIKRAMIKATHLPVYSLTGHAAFPGTVELSDHLNYWLAGYPAVMVTDTAFYRNPHYHARTDTADRLDYGRMAQVVRGVYAAALALAAAH